MTKEFQEMYTKHCYYYHVKMYVYMSDKILRNHLEACLLVPTRLRAKERNSREVILWNRQSVAPAALL